MNRHFDAVAHGPRGRRASLKAIGAAALLTAVPVGAGAGKAGKKAKKTCKRQVGPCREAFDPVCEGSMGEAQCRAAVAECCASLKKCKAGAAMECIIDAFF